MVQAWLSGVLGVILFLPSVFTRSKNENLFPPTPKAGPETVVLVGAGDIADCRDLAGAEATAKLLELIPGTVMAVGDLAYPDGTKETSRATTKPGAA